MRRRIKKEFSRKTANLHAGRKSSPLPVPLAQNRGASRPQAGRKRSLLLLLMAGFIAWGVASRTNAQDAASGEEIYLDPITITATRTPEKISDVADSVEVFSRERIESLLPIDANEFLEEAAGGFISQTGGRGGITAFRLRGGEPNFTSVLFDGFKLTPPSGDQYDFSHLSTEWIGTAEVLKGPQSPLYGSDAAAGVVNFLPDFGKPGETPSFTTRLRLGSHSTYEETFKLKGGSEKSGYVATFSRLDSDGRFPNDGYYRSVGVIGLDHFFSEKAKARFLYYFNQNRIDITSNDGATNTDHRLEAPLTDRELNAYQKRNEQLIGLRAQLRPTRWFEYVPRVSLYLHDTLFEDKADVLDEARPFFSPFERETDQTRLSLNNQINLRFSGKQLGFSPLRQAVSTLGFEWEREEYFTASTFTTASKETRRADSFYAHQQLQFQGGFTLAGGFRVDDFDVGKDETTGKISASYQLPRTGTRLRGAIGEGVKRPAFLDLFGSSFTVGNQNLKSEKQESWEIGFDQFIGGKKLKLGATYYENEVQDFIASSPQLFLNGTNYENISRVRMRGAEFSLALVDFHHFSAYGSFNTLDTVVLDDQNGLGGSSFEQGEELLRRPNWWWSGSITYHPNRLRTTLRVNQTSTQRDIDFTPFLKNIFTLKKVNNAGYTKVDLAFSLDVVKDSISLFDKTKKSRFKDFTVEAKVNNVFDEDYDAVYNYNSPGIEWFAGVNLVF